MLTNRINILILSLCLTIVVYILYSISISSITSKPITISNKARFDSKMDDIVITQYSITGAIKDIVKAASLTHFNKNNQILIEKPIITIFKDNKSPWIIKAQNGKSLNKFHQVDLSGDVFIQQKSGPNNKETTIRTSELTVFPSIDLAKTNAEVIITQPNLTIQSKGMVANFKTKNFSLTSNARCSHV